MSSINDDKITYKTLDQQIDILKSRGMIFNDEDIAKKYLLSNNYYSLINGYSKYFQQYPKDSQNDNYLENTNFDEISKLYFFDKEIKQITFNATLHAERHLKSIFAHRFSEAYKSQKYSYLNINNFDNSKRTQSLRLIANLSNLIQSKLNHTDPTILHYVNKYDDIPIWVFIEFIDFGQLKNLIYCLPTNLQNRIALDLTDFIKENIDGPIEIFTPEIMNSFIKNIHEIRNVCAHNNRLINFQAKSDCSYYSTLHEKYLTRPRDRRRDAFSTIILLQCFISKTEYSILYNSLRNRIKYLNNHIKTIEPQKILGSLGFPIDWVKQPKRIQ